MCSRPQSVKDRMMAFGAVAPFAIVNALINVTCDVGTTKLCCDGPYIASCTFQNGTSELLMTWEPQDTCLQFRGHFPQVDTCATFVNPMHRHLDTVCASLYLSGLAASGGAVLTVGGASSTPDVSTALSALYAGAADAKLELCMMHRKRINTEHCTARLSVLGGTAELNVPGAHCHAPDKTSAAFEPLTLHKVHNHGLLHADQMEALVIVCVTAAVIAMMMSVATWVKHTSRGAAGDSTTKSNPFNAAQGFM